ncbi:hypothetical protein PCANC_27180 [Puccinia coronata f. sp. avenae]|uniref:Uncharacterized protein n=1 Tax=Puccinia coronata f. sp. avenae TaxID=200324 RepID=A0A2N5TK91_9BASI|nr:hypothetical protein PCANC_27180 [Puccinia coronata f. sp. avenae]
MREYFKTQSHTILSSTLATFILQMLATRSNKMYWYHTKAHEETSNQTDSKEIANPPSEGVYSSDREWEECENWQDSIAEGLWMQYVATLEERHHS